MTLEELKEEAKRQGYGIHKLQPYIPIKKCRCGAKPHRIISIGNQDKYVCDCGIKTEWCRSDKEARMRWNEVVG